MTRVYFETSSECLSMKMIYSERRVDMKDSRNVKKASKEYFDSIASDYDNSYDGKFVNCMYQEIIERIQSLDKEPEAILDIGCGNGNIELMLRDITSARLYGIDISRSMIDEANKRLGKRAEFYVGDSQMLPYKDNSFDVVLCNASFHHYPEPVKVLKEVKRVLRNKGVLILGDPTLPSRILLKIMNWSMKYSRSGDYHIYNKQEISTLLTDEGFNITNWKKTDMRTFILNAELI